VASPQTAYRPQNTSGGQNFLSCAKVVLGHFGSTWSILHGTSTKKHGGVKVNPSAPRLAHCFGQIGPTQPHTGDWSQL
jgi:hypothetical protein